MSSFLIHFELLKANKMEKYTPLRFPSNGFIESPLSIRLEGNFDVNNLKVLHQIEADQIVCGTKPLVYWPLKYNCVRAVVNLDMTAV